MQLFELPGGSDEKGHKNVGYGTELPQKNMLYWSRSRIFLRGNLRNIDDEIMMKQES